MAALDAALRMHLGIHGDLRLQPGTARADTFTAAEDEIRATAETFAAWLRGTADAIEWAVDDGAVLTLEVSEDGKSVTVLAGSPGSAVITVTDNSLDPAISATEAVDVVTGGTTMIQLTEGPVEEQ